MPFPGYPVAANKINSTLQHDDHPAHHNELAAGLNDLQLQYPSVIHGTDATVARPDTDVPIIWYGSVAPNNAAISDLWIDTDGASPTIAAPSLITPAASIITTAANAVLFAQYGTFFHRFSIPTDGAYRYLRYQCGVSSGDIQGAVVKLSGSSLLTYDRVMNSGIIASPGAGVQRLDLGRTDLVAGSYALAWWADNTTITVSSTVLGAAQTALACCVATTLTSAGIPATGTLASWVTNCRPMFGLSLEGDV